MIKTLLSSILLTSSIAGVATENKNLQEFYHIAGDTLIDFNGVTHPKIDFSDALHEELCFILKDPEQAEIIHSAYAQHLLPHLPQEFREPFAAALLKVCVLFGSEQFSPQPSLLAALREENDALWEWMIQHEHQMKSFVEKANRPARKTAPSRNSVFTVLILTTTASGGNLSVANAMVEFLSKQGIHCIVLDSETVAKETDLVMLATGATTYDEIYARDFQQNNRGVSALIQRDLLSKQLGKYLPSRFGLELKERARQLHPDLILSTRSYTLDDVQLCTLGIPFRIIHCDYELSILLQDLYGKIEPEMLKFWMPSVEPRVFLPQFTKANRLDLYDERDTLETLLQKLAEITKQPLSVIQGQFEQFGYPISSDFHLIENLEPLREKWKILPEEIPVLVSMGKNGVGLMEEIYDELSGYEQTLPVKYIFVCGRNEHLKNKLEQKARSNSRFSIIGLVSAQEMNELMNLCPVTLSKPGGAVSTEVLTTGTYLLMMGTHPWEEANGAKVKNSGLGQKTTEGVPLVLQVEECLEKAQTQGRVPHANGEWKEKLMECIESIRA